MPLPSKRMHKATAGSRSGGQPLRQPTQGTAALQEDDWQRNLQSPAALVLHAGGRQLSRVGGCWSGSTSRMIDGEATGG